MSVKSPQSLYTGDTLSREQRNDSPLHFFLFQQNEMFSPLSECLIGLPVSQQPQFGAFLMKKVLHLSLEERN